MKKTTLPITLSVSALLIISASITHNTSTKTTHPDIYIPIIATEALCIMALFAIFFITSTKKKESLFPEIISALVLLGALAFYIKIANLDIISNATSQLHALLASPSTLATDGALVILLLIISFLTLTLNARINTKKTQKVSNSLLEKEQELLGEKTSRRVAESELRRAMGVTSSSAVNMLKLEDALSQPKGLVDLPSTQPLTTSSKTLSEYVEATESTIADLATEVSKIMSNRKTSAQNKADLLKDIASTIDAVTHQFCRTMKEYSPELVNKIGTLKSELETQIKKDVAKAN